ncbi:unnamed protein product, partial [Rotaria socialis]
MTQSSTTTQSPTTTQSSTTRLQTTTQIPFNCTVANYSQNATTVVSGISSPYGLAIDSSNNLY